MNIEEQKSIIRVFMDDSKITVKVPFTYERGDTMPRTNEICTPETVYNEVVQDIDEGGFDHLHVEILDYDNSWELLMPVVSKIRETMQDFEYESEEHEKFEEIFNESTIIEAFMSADIQTIYRTCVEFIEWYNKIDEDEN